MAQVHPSGWRELSVTGAAQREIETLTLLAATLPDDYVIFHGVHWTKLEKNFSAYGEIDFIIVAPNGRVLLIEQKSGFLTETEDGLAKKYVDTDKPKLIRTQIMRAVTALQHRFAKEGEALSIDYLLYCPDYQVKRIELAGLDADRIVDASNKHQLPTLVQAILPRSEVQAKRERVLRFFNDVLQLYPDPSAMIGQAHTLVTRLSGGLALWARQLAFHPFRLRVIGTAGSGKTQLALTEFTATLQAGKKPLYVSYNRPLADHVQTLLPSGGRIGSFHQLCDQFSREVGLVPDYHNPQVWQQLEHCFATADVPLNWKFDTLIVDEGQDFSDAWRDTLLRLLKPEGRALWLEDPMQNLYNKHPVELTNWVSLHALTNYRNPRQIVECLSRISPTPLETESASPFKGADIDVLTYADDDVPQLLAVTKQAITRALAAGFTRQDMAIVSFRGRENSAILQLDALGTHTLKSFSGHYDLFGNPEFRAGELLTESVYRFKGQSAPAIIFTEIDFETVDDKTFRKLFVGMTRARLKLLLVMSERAARQLIDKFDS